MFWARSSPGTAVALGAVPIGQVTKVVSETAWGHHLLRQRRLEGTTKIEIGDEKAIFKGHMPWTLFK